MKSSVCTFTVSEKLIESGVICVDLCVLVIFPTVSWVLIESNVSI